MNTLSDANSVLKKTVGLDSVLKAENLMNDIRESIQDSNDVRYLIFL